VGDPKQSIYRFRGADITAYHRARDHVLEQGKELTLVTNFRSPPGILRPVNAIFRGWMGLDPEREPAYVDLESGVESEEQDPAVEIWTVESPRGSPVEVKRGEEAHVVAEAVGSWKRDGIHRYRDAVLLFRALTDVPIYTQALREAGIPFVVDGGNAFRERPEVMEALVLLRALANPADRVAALGVLRSPLGGVGDQELADYAAGGGGFAWSRSPSPEEATRFPGVAGAFALLRDLEERRRTLPLDLWIQRVLSEGDFLLLQSSFPDGAQRAANVRKLAERAAGLARVHGLPLEAALEVLASEFTENRREGESPLADEAVEAVRIMSIHKAKGLEFEVVILPDLARGSPGSRAATRVHPVAGGGESRLAIGIQNGPVNCAFMVERKGTALHEAAEHKRLLYVAMTRAKNRLVLLNSMETIRKGQEWLQALARGWGYAPETGEEPVADGSVLHLRRARGEIPSPPKKTVLDVATPYRSFREACRLAAVFPPRLFRSPSADHRSRRVELANEDEEGGGIFPRDRNLARAAGSAMHRLLEHADFRRPESMRRGAERAAGEEAAALDLSAANVLSELTIILDGFLASRLPRRLAEAEILGREVPVLFRDEAGSVVTGYADLVYRLGGRIHVADYKTDEEASREHAEVYRGQLVDYGEAVRRALGLPSPPALEILFVRQGERIGL
jgi:ATP-dependent helicase/nuclease subunit A